MHILSWNVNGVRAWLKKPKTLEFISRPELSIVCLLETRIDESKINSIQSNFSEFPYQYWCCSETKGYAGLAVLSKIQPTTSKLDIMNSSDKGRVITLEFPNYILIASYFPNSGSSDQFISKKIQWDETFREYLQSYLDLNKEVIWVGDLNIVGSELDYFEAKGKKIRICDEEKESFTKFTQMGFVDSFRLLNPGVRKFTWFSNKFPKNRADNKGWRIDYAMVSQGAVDWIEYSLIHEGVLGSDHVPIELIINVDSI